VAGKEGSVGADSHLGGERGFQSVHEGRAVLIVPDDRLSSDRSADDLA
jgi:hypothetical protein